MSVPQAPIGNEEGLAPPITVVVKQEAQQQEAPFVDNGGSHYGASVAGHEAHQAVSPLHETTFSPRMSGDGSFAENYGEDSSHLQNQSFAMSKPYPPATVQEQQPLYLTTSSSTYQPSQSMGKMTNYSEDQPQDMHVAYSSNSLADQRYEEPSESSHTHQDPYPWMNMNDVKEADDDLHDPTKRSATHGAPQRALLNLGTLLLLILALLMLFAGYPILHHFTEGKEQDDRAAAMSKNLRTNRKPALASGLPINRMNHSLPSNVDPKVRMFIDPDTPKENYTIESTYSKTPGKKLQLVFSDEFNTDGRTFYPGEDPFWEAVDLHYWATNNFEWYDPAAVYTKDGSLRIRLEQHMEHNMFFRGGMLQSWNKFCFRGGKLIASVQLPGFKDVGGLWPAFWLMGNLGRAGYGATLQGTWPYSYDKCDVGTVMNQTLFNDKYPNGFPPDTLNGGAVMFNQKHNSRSLSFLPGQKLSACTCPNEDHPGPWLDAEKRYRGRSAPEIDVFEAQVTEEGPGVSQSFQIAPYNWLYQIDYQKNKSDLYNFYNNPGKLNSYTGEVTQQSISGVNNASSYAMQYLNRDGDLNSQIPEGHPNGEGNFATCMYFCGSLQTQLNLNLAKMDMLHGRLKASRLGNCIPMLSMVTPVRRSNIAFSRPSLW